MSSIRCHYDVLDLPRDADGAMIKKAHRRLALQNHPDKNPNDPDAAERFRLIQQAYECLSDPRERQWYDEHRDAILKGWSAGNPGENNHNVDILFDVMPFLYAGCYQGYGDDEKGFFAIYQSVFRQIYNGEQEGWTSEGHIDEMPLSFLPQDFGIGRTEWGSVLSFYQNWESFSSCLAFAWADPYDVQEAPNRRVRRAMEEENKRARRNAKRERNEKILALVAFVKRRDPRVKAQKAQMEQEKSRKEQQKKEAEVKKKKEAREAREEWKKQAELEMAEAEEQDRRAGRIRLADLEDDYDYGGGGKKGRKNKKKKNKAKVEEPIEESEAQQSPLASDEQQQEGGVEATAGLDDEIGENEDLNDIRDTNIESELRDTVEESIPADDFLDEEEESEESEQEPEIWRCACCRKDFKSEGQMENHMKSKKHKEAFKKWQKKQKKQQETSVDNLLDDLALQP